MDALGLLVDFWSAERVAEWLGAPCKELKGEIPLEVIRDGETELVEEAIYALVNGEGN